MFKLTSAWTCCRPACLWQNWINQIAIWTILAAIIRRLKIYKLFEIFRFLRTTLHACVPNSNQRPCMVGGKKLGRQVSVCCDGTSHTAGQRWEVLPPGVKDEKEFGNCCLRSGILISGRGNLDMKDSVPAPIRTLPMRIQKTWIWSQAKKLYSV